MPVRLDISSWHPVGPELGYIHAVLLVLAFIALYGFAVLIPRYWPSYRNLRGTSLYRRLRPPADSFLRGSLPTLGCEPTGAPPARWFELYGPTLVWRNSWARPDLMTRDPAFVHAVYHSGSFDLGRPQIFLTRKLGLRSALTATEGEAHRRLRRAMMPAFGAPAVQALWPDILDKATELRERLLGVCLAEGGTATVSATQYMQRLAVEVIGKCGFGQDFGVIERGEPSPMEQVLAKLIGGMRHMGWVDHVDVLGILPALKASKRQRYLDGCRREVNQLADDVLRKRRAEVLAELSSERKRDEFGNKDMISVLLRAELASDLKGSHRLSDQEVRDMVPLTLIGATHTTHQTMAWGLHYLAAHSNVQQKLRAELQGIADTWDAVTTLPYLDAVTREVVRLAPANVTQTRTAVRKTVVRLSQPVRGRDGRMMETVTVDKGTSVTIRSVNTSAAVYGSDAWGFRPERHLVDIDEARQLGGQWGNNITFAGGDRGCIGFRLAVAEIKAMLFVMVRCFQIDEPNGLRLQKMGMYSGIKTNVTANEPVNVPGIPIILRPV